MLDWQKILMHSLYVASITFFSLLSANFADGILEQNELIFAFTSAIIAAGMAGTAAWGVQQGENPGPGRKGISKFVFL